MNNDEINKYIHETIFRHQEGVLGDEFCGIYRIPDYCSDESPRWLLNEVVAKVLPTLQFENRQFIEQLRKHDAILLTAEQIARACVEAHKALKEL